MQIIYKGQSHDFPEGVNALDAAKALDKEVYKAALAVRINDSVKSLPTALSAGDSVEFLTWADDDGRRALRHTASHVLAQAVQHLYPGVKYAIGPAIDTGFYYDFDVEKPFTPEDLDKIEAEMRKIIKENLRLERFALPRDEALAFMKDEPYKVELIENLPEGEEISFYKQGDFTDLCAGPHIPGTGGLKAIKLLSATGAYWRGDSNGPVLQRIYGTAFPTKEGLAEYLTLLEEAKKRDHRKLGRELDLFNLYEEGPGFAFFFPKGMVLRNKLEAFWREEHTKAGYDEIRTPIILNEQLWHQSGHWDHYKDNMYFVNIDDMPYAVKPMNCPGGILAFRRRPWSYRDLPLRYAEMGLVHRHELSGALHGLMRVRAFTQDDAHLYVLPEQIQEEIIGVIDLVDRVYKVFGFKYRVELSTRPDNFMGAVEQWDIATEALRQALVERNVDFRINEGDGAFYGPKIDFHLMDSIGRTWQCGTLQLDFQMPERFELEYVGADGEKHRPVMLHRTVLGSMERFIAILVEHYAGAFPIWLAPEQVRVLPITDRNHSFGREITDKLKAAGLRVHLDDRSEKVGYKIREAQVQKIPYMLVLGDQEQASGEIAVRDRKTAETTVMSLDSFIEKVREEERTRAN